MSEADSLRMVAEVVDKFSGPLRALRTSLQAMSKDGASHAEVVQKGFNKVEAAAKSAGQTASTVLNPALAAVGITGLGVVAAMTGVGSAIRAFGGNVAGLAQMGRDTGIAAEQLRDVQSVLGKVGVDAETSAGAIRRFAENMRLARDGIGPIMEFLRTQGRTTEGRAYFNQLADAMKNAKDNGEALSLALQGLEHIQDPAGRRKYAEEILGLADAARLADGHLGTLAEQFAKVRRESGPLDPATVKAAEDFDKAMNGLGATMRKIGTIIATEAMPSVSALVTGIKELVDANRAEIGDALRTSMRELGAALREIDWRAAKEGASDFLKSAASGAKTLVDHIKEIAAVLRALNEGKYMEAVRRMDGSSGPLARKLAPMAGDDEIAAKENADQLRQSLQAAENAKGTWLGQHGLAGAGDPDQIRRQLSEAEEKLKTLRARTPEQRQADFDRTQPKAPEPAVSPAAVPAPVGSAKPAPQAQVAPIPPAVETALGDRIAGIQRQLETYATTSKVGPHSEAAEKRAEDLRRELTRTTDELRRLREALPDRKPGEATAQKSAFEAGDSPFGDAKIQTASFGGAASSMARVGNALADAHRRGMGINVPDGPLRNGRLASPSLDVPDGPLRSGQIEVPGLRDLPGRMPRQSGGGMPPMMGDVLTRIMPQLRPFLRGVPGMGGLPRGLPGMGGTPRPRRFAGLPDGGEQLPDEGAPRRPGTLARPVPRAPRVEPREGGPGESVRRWQRGEPEQGNDGRVNVRQPEKPGQYRPKYELSDADLDQRVVNTIKGEVSTKNAEGVDAVINNMMNRVGAKGWGPSKNLLEVARAPGQYAGYQRAAPAESEFVRSRIKAIASGGVPDNTAGSNSYRAESYYRQTQGRGKGFWADRATMGPNVGGNRYAFEPGVSNGPYAPFDPKAIASARPPSVGTADGEGFAARQRAMKAYGEGEGLTDVASNYRTMQGKMDKLNADMNPGAEDPGMRALRAGALGSTPKLDASGSVHIQVDKAGPDARVSTSTRGDLFRDVTVQRGRTMAQASQGD